MLDVSLCSCEDIHRKAVAAYRVANPHTADLPYADVIRMVLDERIEREGRLEGLRHENPQDISFALIKRRLYDPDRYLRINDGRQPQEMVVRDGDKAEVRLDLSYIPTLAYDSWWYKSGTYRTKAWTLLLEKTAKTLEETLHLYAMFQSSSLRPFFDPLYAATSHLIAEFDPLCATCPVRTIGKCTPQVTQTSTLDEIYNTSTGLISISRRLQF